MDDPKTESTNVQTPLVKVEEAKPKSDKGMCAIQIRQASHRNIRVITEIKKKWINTL